MLKNAFHKKMTKTILAMGLEHVDIAKIREGTIVRDNPRETNLLLVAKQAQSKRVSNAFGDNFF